MGYIYEQEKYLSFARGLWPFSIKQIFQIKNKTVGKY